GAARPARAARQAHHDQALHGRQHDDRGAAAAMLRPRRDARRRAAPVRAVLRRPGVAASPADLALGAVMSTNAQGGTFDPIRFCVFTTVALIAWVFGPPVAVTLMSGLGLWAYWHAWRKGL